MALLQEKDKKYIQAEFEKALTRPVKVLVFTQAMECDYCRETRQIAEEVVALSQRT